MGSTPDILADASLQLYGHVAVDPNWITLTHDEIKLKANEKDFLPRLDERTSRYIFLGPRTNLASVLKLEPGASKTVFFSCQLPTDLPPSYNGTTIKYFYFANLLAQKTMTSEPQSLKLRFRVINPASGLYSTKLRDLRDYNYHIKVVELKSNELNLEDWYAKAVEKSMLTINDTNIRSTINSLFKRHGHTVSININKGEHRLVRFSVEKTVFQLGDVIKGTFDFAENVIPCYQISALLQIEEEIEPKAANTIRSQHTVKRIVNQVHECTHETKKTHFTFHIPIDATQSLQTELVNVRWSLRFEFITSVSWNDRKGELNVDFTPRGSEILNWSLPIRVLVPSYPLQSNFKFLTTQDPKACLEV
eukprot:TRINITY_DN5300_c0_g1_i1.p1 TRINITY_DN5300_c0_g1~~TRINITY_DN5300_c0_g1_i1.p1  ORF type:complete len:412 (-),score=55.19 TRINITY_DN5300_c0_g1_i1:30-1118(-)